MPGETLAPYNVLTTDFRYSLQVSKQNLTLFGQYNNLLHEAYQLINRYPLPLFDWRLGVELAK